MQYVATILITAAVVALSYKLVTTIIENRKQDRKKQYLKFKTSLQVLRNDILDLYAHEDLKKMPDFENRILDFYNSFSNQKEAAKKRDLLFKILEGKKEELLNPKEHPVN